MAEPAEDEVPAWLHDLLAQAAAERGLDSIPWDAVKVTRTTTFPDGLVVEEVLTGREAARAMAFGAQENFVDPADPVPDTVVGTVQHTMVQAGYCNGYSRSPIVDGLERVGGTWDFGLHLVIGPAAAPTQPGWVGVDLFEPTGVTKVTAHADYALTAIGSVQVTETRAVLWGFCFALVGQMSGTGVFVFEDVQAPA